MVPRPCRQLGLTMRNAPSATQAISVKLARGKLVPTEKGGEYILKPIPTADIPRFKEDGVDPHIISELAKWSDKIWTKRSLASEIKATIDGLIYGLLTGGVFGWLWPR